MGYEFCSLQPHIYNDSLSTFLEECTITLKQFGHQYSAPDVCGPRIYGDLELIYVLAGESVITIDGTVYRGYCGDLFVIPKYSVCSICSGEGSFENYWIHLDVGDSIAAEQLRCLLGGCLLHPGDDEFLMQLYAALENLYAEGGEGSYLGVRSLLYLILLRVITLSGGDVRTVIAQDEDGGRMSLLRKCIRFITEYRGAVSVEEMCKKLYISPTYVRRVFRELMGQPPLAFIRSVRIREAELLLLTTDESVSAISAELGFSSPYHFSSEFKRYHSVSPLNYRKLCETYKNPDKSR